MSDPTTSGPTAAPPSRPHIRWPVVLGILAAAVAGSGYYLAPWRESPEDVWAEISTAAAAGDYGAVWDRYDEASRARIGGALSRYPGATDGDRFVRMLADRPDVRAEYLPARVVRADVPGDWAAVDLDGHPAGGVDLVRVNGRWLLCDGLDVPTR